MQATTSEGLAQGPYVAASGIRISDPATEPPRLVDDLGPLNFNLLPRLAVLF